MAKGLSVTGAAKQLFDGDESSVWAAIVDGSLQATALAESQHPGIASFETDVGDAMARCFLAGDVSFRFSSWRQYMPRQTGNRIAITTAGEQTELIVRRSTVVVAVPQKPDTTHQERDLDSTAAKRELERLIEEAPKVAPSIAHYDGKSYGEVTDDGYDTQKVQCWLLEASGILQHLAGKRVPVFGRLNGEYFKLEAESQSYHHRSILVHKTMLLLQTATQLLDSPVGNLAPPSMAHYLPLVESDTDATESPQAVAEVAQLPAKLAPPEKVTPRWLMDHVPIGFWITTGTVLAGLLASSFYAGVQASKLTLIKEIFGL